MAQIGASVSLTCRATGCETPAFSWRTQIDSPLNGKVQSANSTSMLTMDPVSFENEHSYLCTATCGARKAERSIEVQVYCEYLSVLLSLKFALNEVSKGGSLKRKTSSMSRFLARGLDSCTQSGRQPSLARARGTQVLASTSHSAQTGGWEDFTPPGFAALSHEVKLYNVLISQNFLLD